MQPRILTVGEVLRKTETDFDMVECFDETSNTCKLSGGCHLKNVLQDATRRYLEVLDTVTLADLLPKANSPREISLSQLLA